MSFKNLSTISRQLRLWLADVKGVMKSGRRLVTITIILLNLCRLDTVRMQLGSHHHQKLSWSYLLAGIIYGCLQDVCMLIQTYILICIRPRSTSTASIIIVIYSLPLLLDLSLQRWGYPRLSYTDVKTVFLHFSQFTTSFQQVFTEFTSILILTIYIAFILISSRRVLSLCLDSPRRHLCVAFVMSLFITNVILLLRLSQSSQTRYMFDNAVIRLEAEVAADLGLLVPLSSLSHKNFTLQSSIISSVIDDNENYTLLSSEPGHSFWRTTWNYQGPVRFHIQVENRSRPLNVLMVNMESWSHHVVGCLTDRSRNQSLTPEFDQLADHGILFTSHYSPSSQTSRTLLTHLFGIKPKYDHEPALATQSRSLCVYGLADVLKERGYRNEFVSGTDLNWHDWHWFLSQHSFHQCHDRYSITDRLDELGVSSNEYEQQSWGLHDQETMRVLEDRIEQLHNTSQTYFIDYYSVSSHSPFKVPAQALSDRDLAHPDVLASKGKTSANYKLSVIYSDRCLGRLIRSLKSKGLLDDTITIIQGDHGRGKDYRLEGNPELHMVDLLDDFQRIPLLIIPPSNQDLEDPIRITEVSNQYDMMATVLDMLNVTQFHQHGIGQSLMRQPSDPRTIVLDNPINGFQLYAAVTDKVKYVFNTLSEQVCLYDRISDPDELHPDCIDYNHQNIFHSGTKQTRQWIESLEATVKKSYDANQFFPCDHQ